MLLIVVVVGAVAVVDTVVVIEIQERNKHVTFVIPAHICFFHFLLDVFVRTFVYIYIYINSEQQIENGFWHNFSIMLDDLFFTLFELSVLFFCLNIILLCCLQFAVVIYIGVILFFVLLLDK